MKLFRRKSDTHYSKALNFLKWLGLSVGCMGGGNAHLHTYTDTCVRRNLFFCMWGPGGKKGQFDRNWTGVSVVLQVTSLPAKKKKVFACWHAAKGNDIRWSPTETLTACDSVVWNLHLLF